MNKQLSALAGALLLANIGVAGQAAPSQDHPETTVVTATRVEQSVADVLAPVTVFEREDIERIAPTTLQELLERSTGAIFVRNGGRGSATSLLLRGNNSDHVLVLVDGVRIGSATLGSPSLTQLPPEMIERVEIVRGPRSSLYGSEAFGGVVNIITRKYHGTQGVKPMLQLTAGTQQSQKAVAALSGGNDNTQANLMVMKEKTDGVDFTESTAGYHGDKDGFDQQAVNFSLQHSLDDNNRLFALYQNSNSETDYDASCYDTGFTAWDCAPYTDSTVSVANLRGEFQPLNNWQLSVAAGETIDDSEIKYRRIDPAASGIGGDDFKTTRRVYSLQNDIQLPHDQLITVGAERFDDRVNSSVDYGVHKRRNDAYFLQAQGKWQQLNWIAGYRLDDNSQFGEHETASASVGYDLTAAVKVILSYGEGFNAPSFNDLYYPFYGVATLEPETAENIELTVRGSQRWGQWSVSHYKHQVDQLIQYNPATFGPDQINSADIEGTELEVSTELAQWQLSANITLLDATDESTGKRLRRRPEKQLNVDISRDWNQWGVYANWRLLDHRYEDAGNSDRLAGYGIVDAGVSYRVNDTLRLQISGKNILDKDYVSARSFSFGDYQNIGRELMFTVTYTP